jgi:hypothetical protein
MVEIMIVYTEVLFPDSNSEAILYLIPRDRVSGEVHYKSILAYCKMFVFSSVLAYYDYMSGFNKAKNVNMI